MKGEKQATRVGAAILSTGVLVAVGIIVFVQTKDEAPRPGDRRRTPQPATNQSNLNDGNESGVFSASIREPESMHQQQSRYARFAGYWDLDDSSVDKLLIDELGYVAFVVGVKGENVAFPSREPCQVNDSGNAFEVQLRFPLKPEVDPTVAVEVPAKGRLATNSTLVLEMLGANGQTSAMVLHRSEEK